MQRILASARAVIAWMGGFAKHNDGVMDPEILVTDAKGEEEFCRDKRGTVTPWMI